jgi:uncharacterized protein YaaR (DUF327 family)
MWGMTTMHRCLLSINSQLARQVPKAIGSLLILLMTMNSGCTNTNNVKVSDCQNFSKTIGKINTYFDKNAEQGNSLKKKNPKDVSEYKQVSKEYVTLLLEAAQTSVKTVELMQAMSLQDEQLKTFQADYLNIFKKIKEANEKLAEIAAGQSTIEITDAMIKDPKLNPQITQKYQQLDASWREKAKTLQDLDGEYNKVFDKLKAYCEQPNSSSSSPSSSPLK